MSIKTKEAALRSERPVICKVKQSFAKAADINNIVARYIKTGSLGHTNTQEGIFADVSGYGDMASAMRRVDGARKSFAALPAGLRSKFGNDPSSLVAFLQDPQNRDKAIDLGLIKKPAPVIKKESVKTPVEKKPDERKVEKGTN